MESDRTFFSPGAAELGVGWAMRRATGVDRGCWLAPR